MTEVIGARRMSTLLAFPGFARLGTLDVAALSALADEHLVPRGEVLMRAGRVDRASFILDGTVRVVARGRSRLVGPREAVGVLELLADDPDGLEAIAETETRALAISRKAFLDFLEDSFSAMHDTLRALARQLVEISRVRPALTWSASPRALLSPPHCPLGYADKLLYVHGVLKSSPRRLAATAELARVAVEEHHRAGDVLWRAGDAADSVHILISGELECVPRSATPFRVGAGEAVGGLESLAGMPRWHHAVAATDALGLRVDHGDIIDIMEDHIDLALDSLCAIASMLLRLERLS